MFPHLGHRGVHIESVGVSHDRPRQVDGRPDAVCVVCDQCNSDGDFILAVDHPDTRGTFWPTGGLE